MNNEYFTENISDEALVKLTDKMLKFEKAQKVKQSRFNLFKIIPAVAMIALVIGLINLLPYIQQNGVPHAGVGSAVIGIDDITDENAGETIDINSDAQMNGLDYSAESVEVKNDIEFMQAIEHNVPKIYINGVVNVTENEVYILKNQEIYILPDAVLNIYSPNFRVFGDIINDGVINIDSRGQLCMMFRVPTKFGVINKPVGDIEFSSRYLIKGDIAYYCKNITVPEMEYLLNGDLPFDTIAVIGQPGCVVVINEDYTLNVNKTLWFNYNTTLKVTENVTFTMDGKVETFYDVINEGEIIGDMSVFPEGKVFENPDVDDDAYTCLDWLDDMVNGFDSRD